MSKAIWANLSTGFPIQEPANGGAISVGVRKAFAAADAARMRELDELIAAGLGNADPTKKREPIAPEDAPKVKHWEPGKKTYCAKCGKRTREHFGRVHDKCKACRVADGEYRK